MIALKLFFLSTIIYFTTSARILGVYHLPMYSHFQLGDTILKELALRGHEVTTISAFKEKRPTNNFRQIFLTGAAEKFLDVRKKFYNRVNSSSLTDTIVTEIGFIPEVESTLNHSDVQDLIKSNQTFDMVIIDYLHNHAFKGFCYHFNAHCVLISFRGATRWTNTQMGNPGPPSYVPEPQADFSCKMNFLERVYNSILYVIGEIVTHGYMMNVNNELMRKYFPKVPLTNDIFYNVSLMLLNSDVSTTPAVPCLPNMVEIGGFHIKPPKPLPKDLHHYLDNAEDGVIYFSMGSNLYSKDLSADKRNAFLNSFAKVKHKVLWKWENETLPGQPLNVKILKWMPQNDVLAHPNVKVMVTHGGLLSILEAVHYGIPIIGIPIYSDQYTNMKNAEEAGYGISISYHDLSEDTFTQALEEIIHNTKYAENIQVRSKIMHDQPMKPLDKAMFWIEYVLRHNGAYHLRSAALNLRWYQVMLLDVVAFASFICVTVFLGVFICLKRQFTRTRSKKAINLKKKIR